jgi:hypothetical protein
MLKRRASETPAIALQQSIFTMETPSDVIMTLTVKKNYDTETGHKLINNFMILKEIGRGVHGKVKLAQDTTSGELVVSNYVSW